MRAVLIEFATTMHPYSVEGLLGAVPREELDGKTAVEWLAGEGSPEPVVSLAVSSAYGM